MATELKSHSTAIEHSSEQIAIEFLGGLIDPNDVCEGPFPLYTNLRSHTAFVLDKETTGFAGGFGICQYIYPTGTGSITLSLWPRMPDRDTPNGHIDVFDPKPIFELTWKIERVPTSDEFAVETKTVQWKTVILEIELRATSFHGKSLDYAVKVLTRARELWPPQQ